MTYDYSNTSTMPIWQQMVLIEANAIKYGRLGITIHEGKVVEIGKTERVRLDEPSAKTQKQGPQSVRN